MNALFGIQKTINVEDNGICNYLMYHEKRGSKTVVTKNKTTTIRNRAWEGWYTDNNFRL